MSIGQVTFLLFVSIVTCQGEPSYNHYPHTGYYYTTPKTYNTYRDDNVYITDKYGNTVAVEPYWAKSAKYYRSDSDYSPRCYNCFTRETSVNRPYSYVSRNVYVTDKYNNRYLVNPRDDLTYYYNPSYRSGRYYSGGRRYSSNEDYVYINDMYGRTRVVPKSSYLYEYAKGY